MLEGKRIRLVPLEKVHLPLLKEWRNNPAIRRTHFSFVPCTDLGQELWYERIVSEGRSIYFMIECSDRQDERHAPPVIGYCSLSDIDWKKRRCTSSIFIGDEAYWGAGLGTEVLYLLFDYAFSEAGLHKVTIYTFAENERSIKLHSKFARVEGTLVSHEFQDGRWKDVTVLGLTEETYFTEVKDRIRTLLS